MKRNKNKMKGFTLVELLAVIVILAIILVIAVPKVMSVIEDSKKATLESTAKMIASAAEKVKVQNKVLGKTEEITCDSVAKINDLDYEDCDIDFDDNTAKVTIKGSGKFAGLYVCNGTKTDAEATDESCGLRTLTVNLDGGTDTIDYNAKYEAGSTVTLEEPTKEGYTFNGWTVTGKGASVNENILIMGTENTTVTATWERINYFAQHDWSTIVSNVQSESYPYQVGDIKTVEMDINGDNTVEQYTIRVANKTKCSNEWKEDVTKSQTACGFVLEFADIIENAKINDIGTNAGGWPASKMRTYVNSTIYNALPEELRKGIVNTYVVSSYGLDKTTGVVENENAGVLESELYWSNDKLYLLSVQEVWGTSFTNKGDSSNGTSRQLDYYEGKSVTTKSYGDAIKKNSSGSASNWWLRSANSSYSHRFYGVITNGAWNFYSATDSYGVSPAFRLAN